MFSRALNDLIRNDEITFCHTLDILISTEDLTTPFRTISISFGHLVPIHSLDPGTGGVFGVEYELCERR